MPGIILALLTGEFIIILVGGEYVNVSWSKRRNDNGHKFIFGQVFDSMSMRFHLE
jgi:hypothetical protein